jgi:hypothetical protein
MLNGGRARVGYVRDYSNPTSVTLASATDRLEVVESINLATNITLTAPTGATITVGRDVRHQYTDETKMALGGAVVLANGSGAQVFEVGGLDVDTFTNILTNDNFGFGRLVIGQSAQPTVVDLRDDVNNGNRGAGGAAEAMYLFGPRGRTGTPQVGDPDALQVLGGSTFIIKNYNVYALQSSGWIRLQDQFAGGSTFTAFGGGYLSKSFSAVPGAWNQTGSGNWSSSGNWFMGLPNGAGATAVFGDKITAPAAINVDIPVTVGLLGFDNAHACSLSGQPISFNTADGASARIQVENAAGNGNHSIANQLNLQTGLDIRNYGTGSLTLSGTLNNPLGKPIAKTGPGLVIISGAQSHGTNALLHVEEGTLRVDTDAGSSVSRTLNLLSTGGTTIFNIGTIYTSQHLASMDVAGGTVQLATGGNKVIVTGSLNMAGTGRLDLTNNKLTIDYGTNPSPAPTIRSYLLSGYAGGAWNGVGIDTSSGDSGSFALGFVDGNDNPGGFAHGVAAGQIEVIYTRYGDLNLDGVVNATDSAIFLHNFGRSTSRWIDGDLNYDGVVNATDSALFLTNFGRSAGFSQIPPLDAATMNALMLDAASPVPEPTSVGLLAATAVGLLSRRRRRRR